LRKTLGLAVLAALVLGCGSAGGGTTSESATASGLSGRVMRGPVMPVCRVGVPCDEPARGVKLIFYRSGKIVARTTTNQRGRYRIALRSGPYAVRTDRPRFERVPQPSRVTVPNDRVKTVNFHIDTGIR
jgi:hypothetical protein